MTFDCRLESSIGLSDCSYGTIIASVVISEVTAPA